MKTHGHIPGGDQKLKDLLYPFYTNYPIKLWSKFRWWRNGAVSKRITQLDQGGKWLTVINRLGAPGDTLITANVIHCIKYKYPRLKINCITPFQELLKFDPHIDSLNQKETFYSIDSSYLELVFRKEKNENIVGYNLKSLGIFTYEYRARFYLNEREKKWANKNITTRNKPSVAICTRSKETVKNWPFSQWEELIESLKNKFLILHLGDESEPVFKGVKRFAGLHTMRESSAILSLANLFIGPDSLLMHVANGLNIPSVIIFGGSRPVECFGYKQNINLSTSPQCSPCWIHNGIGECNFSRKCLSEISVSQVLQSVNSIISI